MDDRDGDVSGHDRAGDRREAPRHAARGDASERRARHLPAVRVSTGREYGRINGEFTVERAETGGTTASKGELTLTSASWTPGGPFEDEAFRADTGGLTWRFANGRLEFTNIAASGKDFQATGSGIIRIVAPITDSPMDIRFEVTPGTTMPPTLRRYFDAIQGSAPTTQGTRTFTIQGPLRDARLVGPPGRE
jgi:hypothetical protein